MTAFKNTFLQPLLIAMTLFVALGLTACTATKKGAKEVTMENGQTALQLKGKVYKISKTRNLLTINPAEGDKVTFKVLDSTIFKSTESLETIKVDMPVRVTYSTDDEGNNALIIKRLPDGSCG
jgi:hypothetical protein